MSSPGLRPAGITADRGRKVLTVRWNDGHTSEYGFAGLREACPCAECRGGHENMGAPPDPNLFTIPLAPRKSDVVNALQAVGNYALQITWGDGHQYGIYAWETLRGLCPCETCRAERDRHAQPDG
ncbi:MAG: DUF971 domain-containing protein [Chloroflexi bacterium]|nr:DUF971 domain-containing protein [Chloroflexota bacterium]